MLNEFRNQSPGGRAAESKREFHLGDDVVEVRDFGDPTLQIHYREGAFEAMPVWRGVVQHAQIRTDDQELLNRFLLLRFGWAYRSSHRLAEILGPTKEQPLPDGVTLDTTDLLNQELIWRDGSSIRTATNVSPAYAYYLGLSLPFTLEELDAALRHPTGAPIFVPQPPFDASRLPRTNPSTGPTKQPRRPWFRRRSGT